MFTARYGLIPYIKQIRLIFRRLKRMELYSYSQTRLNGKLLNFFWCFLRFLFCFSCHWKRCDDSQPPVVIVTHRGCRSHLVLYCEGLGFGGGGVGMSLRHENCRISIHLTGYVRFYRLLSRAEISTLSFPISLRHTLIISPSLRPVLPSVLPLHASQPSISMLPRFPHAYHMFRPSHSP